MRTRAREEICPCAIHCPHRSLDSKLISSDISPFMPSLSLIVPIYNVAEYLSATLDSIARQTLSRFEVILVDDGSIDGSREIAEDFCQQQPHWQLITQEQQGVSVARNVGTLQASGNFVAYLDGDDWLCPKTLETLLREAEHSGADMVQSGFFYAYSDYLLYDNRRQQPQDAAQHFDTEMALAALCQPHPVLNNFLWAKVVRRDIALACPNPPGRVAQDAFVMHEMVAQCQKVVCMPQPLWFYRQRNTGLSGRFSIKRKDLLEAYEARINFCQHTQRTHLLEWVIPEYLHQIFLHCAAAKRTKDKETCLVFEQYAQNAKRQYAPLIEQYAPRLWMKLKWEQNFLWNILCRIKGRLFHQKMLVFSYKDFPTV